MMNGTGFLKTSLYAVSLLLFTGCAHAPPAQLVSAREAYKRAEGGPATRLAPAELYKAGQALKQAEYSFGSSADAPQTVDLAYVAERKVQYAEAVAATQAGEQARAHADQEYQNRQGQLMRQTQGELAKTRAQLALEGAQLSTERQARQEAERRASEAEQRAQDALSKLAAVKKEDRGLVITLSGSVLFTTDQATLLPEARTRLDQVAQALLETKGRNVIVEGYTDSRGSENHNLDLSQRRADTVREYLVSRGYPSDKIQARGLGKSAPIADNTTAEGRANNRRVEIVIQPQVASGSGASTATGG